jgi:hypothetical protein
MEMNGLYRACPHTGITPGAKFFIQIDQFFQNQFLLYFLRRSCKLSDRI